MGRAFEFRKGRKMKRWAHMSKTFTKIGREIAMAVKAGGGDPEGNSRLRAIIANAKAENMPKTNIENAILKASNKQDKAFEEVVYEGKGPHSVALVIETATDNTTRTVANIRSYFNKRGGQLLVSGSLDFMFERTGIFKVLAKGLNMDELELELIDFGMEEMEDDGEGHIMISVPFTSFGGMQKALEDRKIEIINAELVRLPSSFIDVSEEQEEEVNKLIEMIEEDDDVTNVFHNMKFL
ncbi:MAG: YebC/PmpR family DNA-binding transcriptional regulator [Bacteroidota bacterium]